MTFKQCKVEIEVASHMSHKIRREKNERENWLIVCHLGLDRYLAGKCEKRNEDNPKVQNRTRKA